MKYLDLTLATPAENLACDEALLEACEGDAREEVLRTWESPEYFVALGYANRAGREVNLAACRELGVPVLRRCSGGGAVLQGPGCLNYAVVLRFGRPETATIQSTNQFVMERHRAAIAEALGQPVTVEGVTDLALAGKKFSGNAQRRRQTALLFHGTLLLQMDLELMAKVLAAPSREPDYRARRNHAQFLTCLPRRDRAGWITLLRAAWRAREPCPSPATQAITQLVAAKYSRPDWNLKFL